MLAVLCDRCGSRMFYYYDVHAWVCPRCGFAFYGELALNKAEKATA